MRAVSALLLLAPALAAAQTFSLITVTYAGEVRFTDGFPSLRTCQQAKSLATTGRTLEEQAAWEEVQIKRYREEEAKREAWAHAHPPRSPTPDERKQLAVRSFINRGSHFVQYTDEKRDMVRELLWDGLAITEFMQTNVRRASCVTESR